MIQSVISKAVSHKGYKEGVNNDNIFAKEAGHSNHQPWCATFVVACFKEAGDLLAIPNTAYCPTFEAWGKAQKRIIPTAQAIRGDLILMDFTKSGQAQHIGIATHDFDKATQTIQTIEGNTGDINQANGDGVYLKSRPLGIIRAVVRPNYKETP